MRGVPLRALLAWSVWLSHGDRFHVRQLPCRVLATYTTRWDATRKTRKAISCEYEARARRRLDEVVLDYLFLDASFLRMHPGSPAELVLAAWGIDTGGKPVFIGLAPGSGESTGAWADFLEDLTGRGLGCRLLVISDPDSSGLGTPPPSTQPINHRPSLPPHDRPATVRVMGAG